MSRVRRVTVVAVAAGAWVWSLGGAAPAAAVGEARTCATAAGSYEVVPPLARPGSGADPAAVAAADCTLGFDEQIAYPISVIGLCLVATAVTLVLVRRATAYEAAGSGA